MYRTSQGCSIERRRQSVDRTQYCLPLHYNLSEGNHHQENQLSCHKIHQSMVGIFSFTTMAVLHRSSVMNIPTIDSLSTKALLSLISSIPVFPDALIQVVCIVTSTASALHIELPLCQSIVFVARHVESVST